MSPKDRITRRSALKATAATVGGLALAGCSGGGTAPEANSGDSGGDGSSGDSGGDSGGDGSDDSGSPQSFGGWLSDTSNYDGVVDKTGSSEVEITVGVKANGANYGFGPAAVKVSSGTKVVWKWNGKGGSHNVVGKDVDFESKLTDEEGHTFSQTFDSAGTHKYFCRPHRPLGMRGVVVVE